MYYLIDIAVLIIIYFKFFLRKWNNAGKDLLLINTLMYLYISLVLYVTLMPIIASIPFVFNHPYQPMNLLPFDDYIMGRGDTVRQILLNIIMMMPFGFLFPILKERTLLSCTLWTFLFSLSIELIQPLNMETRSSDVTDLITNTIGGLIGYILYRLFKPIIKIVLKKINPSSSKRY